MGKSVCRKHEISQKNDELFAYFHWKMKNALKIHLNALKMQVFTLKSPHRQKKNMMLHMKRLKNASSLRPRVFKACRV